MKKSKTPTFLLELPLAVDPGQAKRLRAHFEAARQLYNALLAETLGRLKRMRADPRWQAARTLPRSKKRERAAAFSQLRQEYGFSEYALHAFAKDANCFWLADHIDSMLAQTLATRAYQAVNRVCLGKAKKVRFRSKGRGLDSVENKWGKSGLRFALQPPEEGNLGWLIWGKDRLPAIIDWYDPVVKYGLDHRIKYARLVRHKASSPKAQGADAHGYRYLVQLILEGTPYRKPKRAPGMLIDHLKRTVASTGGTLTEFPTRTTKLSQYCHCCRTYTKKPLSQRWHQCACGIGPIQRDLYSAFLAAYLEPQNIIPSIAHDEWEGAELRLRAAMERLHQRAKEGHVLPRSVGITLAGARLPKSPVSLHQGLVYRRGKLEELD